MATDKVNELKIKGNEAFQSERFEESIKFFSDAIELDPSNHVLVRES
jgi:stress-induced-phosphoprotein 1